MDKRYQVFVSSTYTDLKEERQQVMQALMEMDCIPAGMELFPAADEEQWQFIKKVIDDCDYYLVIIGGRYGTVTNDGISFTEKEYNYARSKNLKIVALIHEMPDELPAKFVEADSDLKNKLQAFRDKISKGRLVKFWNNTEQLIGLVALSMQKTIKMYPAKGWVRTTSVTTEELLIENNRLKEENKELRNQLGKYASSNEQFEEIRSQLQKDYVISGTGSPREGTKSNEKMPWKAKFDLRDIFVLLAPNILAKTEEYEVSSIVEQIVQRLYEYAPVIPTIEEATLRDIGTVYRALNLVEIKPTRDDRIYVEYFWNITELGDKFAMSERLNNPGHTLAVPFV
jgi:hypothetical protein